jgi:hypothetical protein
MRFKINVPEDLPKCTICGKSLKDIIREDKQ